MKAVEDAYAYFRAALGHGEFAVAGVVLYILTIALAAVAAHNEDAQRGDWYTAVAVTTAATGITAAADFAGHRWITPITVALGSFALLVSQSLWAEDRSNQIATGLFISQLAAVGIQIGAISNTPGRAQS